MVGRASLGNDTAAAAEPETAVARTMTRRGNGNVRGAAMAGVA